MATAVRLLRARGHRRIVYQGDGTGAKWLRYRYTFIAEEMAQNAPEIELVDNCDVPLPDKPLMQLSRRSPAVHRTIKPILDSLKQKYALDVGLMDVGRHDRRVLYITSSLSKAVIEQNATAVIAPNDECANVICHWLGAAGIHFPADVSVVSFDDNLARQYPFAISSVNFGFDRLGYLAGHCIMGDLSVRVGGGRSVAAMPTLNHTGSIGTVRA